MSDFEMKYIPIFRDIAKLFFSISDEDCGRIVKNLIHYSNGEDVIPFNDPLRVDAQDLSKERMRNADSPTYSNVSRVFSSA